MSRGGGAVKWRRIAGAFALLMLAFALLLAGTETMGTAPVAAQDDVYIPPGGDYDLDDDGLIEIRTLEQLNAIRWNLSGNGFIVDQRLTSSPSYQNRLKFRAAFPGAIVENYDDDAGRYIVTPFGCPRGVPGVAVDGWCDGFELVNDLDFDRNGDGKITEADGPFPGEQRRGLGSYRSHNSRVRRPFRRQWLHHLQYDDQRPEPLQRKPVGGSVRPHN